MGATSNEGVGLGSVEKSLPKIVNGVVKKENIQQGKIFENFTLWIYFRYTVRSSRRLSR